MRGCWHQDVELHLVHTAASARGETEELLVPICQHHRRLGSYIGWKKFQKQHGVDLVAAARGYLAADQGLAP